MRGFRTGFRAGSGRSRRLRLPDCASPPRRAPRERPENTTAVPRERVPVGGTLLRSPSCPPKLHTGPISNMPSFARRAKKSAGAPFELVDVTWTAPDTLRPVNCPRRLLPPQEFYESTTRPRIGDCFPVSFFLGSEMLIGTGIPDRAGISPGPWSRAGVRLGGVAMAAASRGRDELESALVRRVCIGSVRTDPVRRPSGPDRSRPGVTRQRAVSSVAEPPARAVIDVARG